MNASFDDNTAGVNRNMLASGLTVVGLVWYGVIWSIGLLGCWAAYVIVTIYNR